MKTKSALLLVLLAVAVGTAAIAQQPLRVAESAGRLPQGYGNLNGIPGINLPSTPPFTVSLIHQAQVPGQEPGVLVELNVVEGQQVREGEVLGKIDDTQPYMQGRIATQEWHAAKEKAKNDVDIRYAKKASDVAKKEWEKSVLVNERVKNAVSEVEAARQKLTWERGLLEIERAESERLIASFTEAAKLVEIEAAHEAMKRREIRSPVDGIVAEVYLHKGEWVRPGDAVLHVVQLDRLRVEGQVPIAAYSPAQIMDRSVAIEATLQDRKVHFNGRITFIRPVIEGAGDAYWVKAEVENRKENGHWLLLPGMFVDLKMEAQ